MVLVAVVASICTAFSQQYSPMTKEGKTWKEYSDNGFVRWEVTYSISGDTIIDGKTYSRLMWQSDIYQYTELGAPDMILSQVLGPYSYAGIREIDGRVYMNRQGKESLLYDFTLSAGDIAYQDGSHSQQVTSVDTICIGGRMLRRLSITETQTLSNYTFESKGYWVEGIGCNYGFDYPHGWDVIPTYYLSSCYEDSTLIFSAEDFEAPAISGNGETPTSYSMFADGRNWRYEYLEPDGQSIDGKNEGYIKYDFAFKVGDDVLFDGHRCKEILTEGMNGMEGIDGTSPFAYGYEEGGCVMLYALNNIPAFYAPFPTGQWVTLYDFNVQKDSHSQMGAFLCSDMIVSEVGMTEDVYHRNHLYIGLSDARNSAWPKRYAIEGIGSSFGLFEFENIIDNGSGSRFVGCYDGDVCIFTADDFNDLTNTEPVDNESYRPLVEEGKHWTYDNFMPLRPAEYDHYYYYDLKGDTLIAGQQCLKMYSDNINNDSAIRYEGALYEVNKKVYCFFPRKDNAELLYDFDCAVGDTVHVYNGKMVVKDIQMEDNGGIAIKKYIFRSVSDYFEDDIEFFWVEGVGAFLDFFAMIPAPGNYSQLTACELNGEKLYQAVEPELTDKGYHKMGIEGKRWNYVHYHLEDDGWHEAPYSYVVKGDTVIRRTTYKKLYYQDEKTERFECLLFETGRTVYKNTDLGNNSYDSPVLNTFFEFDREDFGRVFTWKADMNAGNTNWMIYGVDTIEVKGQPFRRYTCLQKYSEEGEKLTTIDYDDEGVWRDIWVEGVGSATSGIENQNPFHEPYVRTPGEYTAFVSCYEDGECIFTADDFYVQTADDNIAYRPFVEEGKVWKVGGKDSGNPVQRVDYYYFDGDTIINGKTCKQMMCQRYVNPDYPNYEYLSQQPSLSKVGAWYEEDKKVYTYDAINKQFKMVYDFSPDTNDTLLIDYYYQCLIEPKQTGGLKGFKGVYRDIMCFGDGAPYYNTTWLEGVGGIDGPTRNIYDESAEYVSDFLMSCTVGDEVIYLNDEYEDGATPEVLNARKQQIDFTHTIKTRPKAPKRDVVGHASQRDNGEPVVGHAIPADAPTRSLSQRDNNEPGEERLYGEYNALQLDINLTPLDDAYLVRITDESDKAVYEKSVNAGSIVGLNIDISTYAEGRYTVTVENSEESFTGQFEAQMTRIRLGDVNGDRTVDVADISTVISMIANGVGTADVNGDGVTDVADISAIISIMAGQKR